MKSKNLIIGTASITVLTAVFMFTPFNFFKKSGEYSQTKLKVIQEQNANDARIWLDARYVDLETGEKITSEKLHQLYEQEKKRKRSNFVFEELGPDNIGGRTRAILIDRTLPNLVWAGGVTGGLFVSYNSANTWQRVDDFPGLPTISSMTQTPDGTIFVGTGMSAAGSDSWTGNGLYYKMVGSDQWQVVPGTSGFSLIEEVVSSDVNNTVFFATVSGLKKWTVGDAAISSVFVASGNCSSLQISKDGQVIVATVGSSNKTYVSNNAGESFTDMSGTYQSNKVPAGAQRVEYAISPTKNSSNQYSLYAVRTGGNLSGMHVSHDNGNTWYRFVGASGTPSNLDIYRDQGTYNSVVSVAPNNPERILVGGIDIWEWKQTVNNPPAGGFEQLSLWFLDPTSSSYVHADNHEMKWDKNHRLYIGNDGGISISDDYGASFFPANRGYNVTQFYGIAMDRDGAVMGGAQDNGTLYNDFSSASYNEFTEVGGGDGFECEISFFNPNVMFTSVYHNSISRSGDKGLTFSAFEPTFPGTYGPTGTASAAHPFHTEFVLAEYYDENSEDLVSFMPKKDYAAGAIVRVPSMSTGDTIAYQTPTALYYDDTVFANSNLTRTDYKVRNGLTGILIDLGQNSFTTIYNASGAANPVAVGDTILVNGTTEVFVSEVESYEHYFAKNPATNEVFDLREEELGFNVSWDTIDVVDPYQSWFIVYAGASNGEIWGTRDALRLAKDAKWVKLATGLGFGSVDIEFSKDLNYCFVSCGSKVYRLDGMGSMYSQNPTFATDAASITKKQISSQNCEGIALNPSNPNDLILLQGFSGSITRSANATASGTVTFTPLTSLGVGAYDAIIDRNNSSVIVVGTAFGVKVSENGGGSWEDASEGFNNVPVFEVRQNWRTWDEGCKATGQIYLGTFGRGIWVSTSFVGLGDNNDEKLKSLNTGLKIYPNPTRENATISYNQLKNGNVSVKVYNLAGVLVKTIELKNVEKGSQTINLDTDNLPNGTYVVKLMSNTVNESVKFIKM